MYLDRRLWAFTRGVRLRIAGTVLLGLLAVAAVLLAFGGWYAASRPHAAWTVACRFAIPAE